MIASAAFFEALMMSIILSRRQALAASGALASTLVSNELQAQSGTDDAARARVKNLLKTLDIKVPIFQAPFGGATTPALAASIANAGGLGGLSITFRSAEETAAAIKATLAMTSAPFVVNVVLTHFEPRNVLIALDAGAKLISFSVGRPDQALVRRVMEAGARFMCQAGTLDAAQRAFDLGAIAVIAQGMEAGGHHEGSTPRRQLLDMIVEKLPAALIVTAGGISSSDDILADLRAGAAGVTIGTPLLATPQANVHPVWQEAIIQADENSTAVTSCFSDGWDQVHRVLRNATLTDWESAGMPRGDKRPGAGDIIATNGQGAPVRRYHFGSPGRKITGQVSELPLYAGKSAVSVKTVRDAAEVLKAYWNPAGSKLGLDLA